MKYLIALIGLALTALDCLGASPTYSNFNTNDFTTNTVIGGQISIRVNTNRFVTTNMLSASGFWGSNAATGFITNVNYGFGVKADDTLISTNEVLLWAESSLPGGTNIGFRFQPFSFHGGGFNIDSAGDGTTFGTQTSNATNFFQVGSVRETLPIEVLTDLSRVYIGTNLFLKRNITIGGQQTNTLLSGAGPRLMQVDADGGVSATLATNLVSGGVGEVLVYTNASPVADSILPSDQTRGAVSYKQDGNGSMFIWDNATLSWK